jgi:hypothetical protein
MSKKKHEIGAFRAIFNSFFGISLSYFPRFKKEANKYEQILESKIIVDVVQSLDKLQMPADINPYLERGRESLDEVKTLTEYQDQKVTRLLTIVAFLSALSGALFSRFADAYPLRETFTTLGWFRGGILVMCAYAFFGLFALSAVCGALVVFHATRTRFKYPDPEPPAEGAPPRKPGSYIFFPEIIKVTPTDWAKSFISPSAAESDPAQVTMDTQLPLRYFKNYVAESYLVAAKVADKLRYMMPAQSILLFSIRMLLIWVLLFAITLTAVPATAPKKGDQPSATPPAHIAPAAAQPAHR